MSYVGDKYEQDIFFSYAHGNDLLHKWSHKLAVSLKQTIEVILEDREKKLRLWTDEELSRNTSLTASLQRKVNSSAALVVVVTGHYVQSPWCAREAAWFAEMMRRDAAAGDNRIFVIRAQNIADAKWPSFLRDRAGVQLPGFQFCDPNEQDALPWRLHDDNDQNWGKNDQNWGKAMTSLARQLANFLRGTRQATPLPTGHDYCGGTVTKGEGAELTKGPATRPRVFVGFATEDLEEERAALAQELAANESLNVVAPDRPDDVSKIRDVVETRGAECHALVQLCGRAPGRWGRDTDGFVAFQIRAFERSRKPQWLVKAAGFDPAKLAVSVYAEMLRARSAELGGAPDTSTILEAFKGPGPSKPCAIYITSRMEYRSADERLRDELMALPTIRACTIPVLPVWALDNPDSMATLVDIRKQYASKFDAELLILTDRTDLLEADVLTWFLRGGFHNYPGLS